MLRSAIWQKRWAWHKTVGSLSKTKMLLFKVFWRLRTCSIMYPSLIWNPYKCYSLKTLSQKGDTLNYNNSEMNFNSLISRILYKPFESGQQYMTLYDYSNKPLWQHPTGAILSLIFQKIDLRFFLEVIIIKLSWD